MKAFAISIIVALAAGGSLAADLDKLKVLYLGDTDTPRAKHFEGFLRENVAQVKVIARTAFKQSDAEGFDVVLLDWPQSDSARDERKSGSSPLGARATWGKPTVLLGSAGLNLAGAWRVRGGSG
jgi:hypothetical protein